MSVYLNSVNLQLVWDLGVRQSGEVAGKDWHVRARIYGWSEGSFGGDRPAALSLPAEGSSVCRGAEAGGWVTHKDSHGHHPDPTCPRPAGPQQAVENQTVLWPQPSRTPGMGSADTSGQLLSVVLSSF